MLQDLNIKGIERIKGLWGMKGCYLNYLHFLNDEKKTSQISFVGIKSMCGTYSRNSTNIDLSHHKETQQHLNIKGIERIKGLCGMKGCYLNYLHFLNDEKKHHKSLSLGLSLCVVPTQGIVQP